MIDTLQYGCNNMQPAISSAKNGWDLEMRNIKTEYFPGRLDVSAGILHLQASQCCKQGVHLQII